MSVINFFLSDFNFFLELSKLAWGKTAKGKQHPALAVHRARPSAGGDCGNCRQKPLALNTHSGPGDGCGEERSIKFLSAERLSTAPPKSVIAAGCFLSLQQLGMTTCQPKNG